VLLNEDKNNSHTNYLAHHSNLDCTKEIKGPNEVIVDGHPLHMRSTQCYHPHQRDDFQTYGNRMEEKVDYNYLNNSPQVRDNFLFFGAGETSNDSQTNSAINNKLECIQNHILIEKDDCQF